MSKSKRCPVRDSHDRDGKTVFHRCKRRPHPGDNHLFKGKEHKEVR